MSDEDPFEQFDVDDRDGDPFEELREDEESSDEQDATEPNSDEPRAAQSNAETGTEKSDADSRDDVAQSSERDDSETDGDAEDADVADQDDLILDHTAETTTGDDAAQSDEADGGGDSPAFETTDGDADTNDDSRDLGTTVSAFTDEATTNPDREAADPTGRDTGDGDPSDRDSNATSAGHREATETDAEGWPDGEQLHADAGEGPFGARGGDRGTEQAIHTDHEGDPFEADDSVFQRHDIEGVDADEVWDRITEARQHSVGEHEESVESVVNKHRYCETCEYFSSPPDIHCTNDGTTILEFTDVESVKVHNCPVVAERRELERMDE